MKMHKTHPSNVIQSGNRYVHQPEVIHWPAPRVAICTGTTLPEVWKWCIEKQKKVFASEKLMVLHYFNTPNMS
jgi:hypothetical protein